MAAIDDLGRRGEELAAQFLVAGGYTIVDRNWRCARGEIDLVARDGNDTVFVEVKTRTSTAFGHPFEAITARKLARLRRLAMAWCDAHPYRRGLLRIDAIAVILGGMEPGDLFDFRNCERCFTRMKVAGTAERPYFLCPRFSVPTGVTLTCSWPAWAPTGSCYPSRALI